MKTLITKILICLCLLFTTIATVFAADPPPLTLLKNVSDQMLVELNKNLGHLKNNDALVANIVRRNLLPHVDVTGMSHAVIGRTYWQNASSSSQQQFIKQFTTYVIRTYSVALSSYDKETITLYPIRGYKPGQTHVQINSTINHTSRPASRVQYRLANVNGTWRVYDFSVDGVSFIQNYRSQFASTLQQGGLALLVQRLVEKNKNYNY